MFSDAFPAQSSGRVAGDILTLHCCHMARTIRHMAEKNICGESLSQALNFLGEKSVLSKGDRFASRRPPTGLPSEVKIHKVKSTRKVASRKPLKQVIFSTRLTVDLKPNVIDRLADKLDVSEMIILSVSGISERTFHRRQKQGEPLTTDEADRVLRIARVAGEAERVFGDSQKSRRWLARENALLGASPLSLLATDAGSRDVEAELMRIDWGDFA